MIQLFKDANFDWLRWKWLFITLSVLLMTWGAISTVRSGFNLGVEFAGGSLINVKFVQQPDPERIRQALAHKGIDTTKVTIQRVTSSRVGSQLLIRTPQIGSAETEGAGIDAGKRATIAALKELDFSSGQGNKIEVNNVGTKELADELIAQDPLSLRSSAGESIAGTTYNALASRIVQFRDKEHGGIVTDIAEIPFESVSELTDQQKRQLKERASESLALGGFNVVSVDSVGPQAGAELRERALYVTLAALVGMLVYVAFRFEWIYGVAAVLAVFHDVLITLGFFSITHKEVSLSVIAALLTLVGYSMNDTIVVFDRVRENLHGRRREDLGVLVNDSINQTLSRTVLTSGLTMIAVLALYVFGGEVLNGFAFALLIGIIIGTYSSIAIAAPIMIWWKMFRERLAARARAQTRTKESSARAADARNL